MIAGRFGDIGELLFEIELIGADREGYPVEVLLDTGFTTGWLVLDTQDVESLGWSLIENNRTMQMARGEAYFDIYEGRVVLDEREYVVRYPCFSRSRNCRTSTGLTVVENTATCCEFYCWSADARVKTEKRSLLNQSCLYVSLSKDGLNGCFYSFTSFSNQGVKIILLEGVVSFFRNDERSDRFLNAVSRYHYLFIKAHSPPDRCSISDNPIRLTPHQRNYGLCLGRFL